MLQIAVENGNRAEHMEQGKAQHSHSDYLKSVTSLGGSFPKISVFFLKKIYKKTKHFHKRDFFPTITSGTSLQYIRVDRWLHTRR